METLKLLIQFVAAAGFGGIVGAICQSWLNGRSATRMWLLSQRQEAYLSLYTSYRDQQNDGQNKENSIEVEYCKNRCRLVGSSNLVQRIKEWDETKPFTTAQANAWQKTEEAMRADIVPKNMRN